MLSPTIDLCDTYYLHCCIERLGLKQCGSHTVNVKRVCQTIVICASRLQGQFTPHFIKHCQTHTQTTVLFRGDFQFQVGVDIPALLLSLLIVFFIAMATTSTFVIMHVRALKDLPVLTTIHPVQTYTLYVRARLNTEQHSVI